MKQIDWRKEKTSELVCSLILARTDPLALLRDVYEMTDTEIVELMKDPKRSDEMVARFGSEVIGELDRRIPIGAPSPNEPHVFAASFGSQPHCLICGGWQTSQIHVPA